MEGQGQMWPVAYRFSENWFYYMSFYLKSQSLSTAVSKDCCTDSISFGCVPRSGTAGSFDSSVVNILGPWRVAQLVRAQSGCPRLRV